MLSYLKSFPTHMDYKGQQLAEQTFQRVIVASAIIGFIYGYIIEQFGWTVYIVLAGFAISCLLTLPPWPMYRNHPLNWQPEVQTEEKKQIECVKKPKKHK
ncbi:signal peptidase complex subunit 1 isoform X1 [Stegostoma tigrinum]|uniref:signal peptidase complex subunit 1 isoform X1 n=1 Tax=Stegostoma tigrinum TaxID=3053191 RepID=UPI00202AD27F|nr:signal peptidase complex subunit 1 isoform X1 [Stegostoma tigrinum]